MLELPSTAKMPTDQDQFDVSIDLVTMAGTEYTMQTNLTHNESFVTLWLLFTRLLFKDAPQHKKKYFFICKHENK